MMKNNIEPNLMNYLKFSNIHLKRKNMLSALIMMWLVGTPCALLGALKEFTTVFFGILNILFTVLIIYNMIKLPKRAISNNMINGFISIYFSLIFVFAAYKFSSIEESNIMLLVLMLIIWMIVAWLYIILIKYNIKKDKYNIEKHSNGNMFALGIMGGVAGMFFGRMFLADMTQDAAYIFLSVAIYMLALITIIGVTLVYKAYIQRKVGYEEEIK